MSPPDAAVTFRFAPCVLAPRALAPLALLLLFAVGCGSPRPAPVRRPPPVVVRPAPRPPVVTPPPAPLPPPEPETAAPGTLPGPMREFRGAWIATVANIDWPTESGMSAQAQQDQLVALLDGLAATGINAVVLQVRTAADALYRSPLEPWSAFLTGRQGGDPGYDPLAFAVAEAHARGMELHAWFNPYRAGHPSERGSRVAGHVSRTMPDAVVRYGDYLWLDPGHPDATEHSLAVILDVVERYDVDGVHLDDYFYPYPDGGRDFPDGPSYRRAQDAGETLGRADWRRQNVDRFIEALYRRVKAEKPWVKVGISPFGIWRPGHPEGITGMDAYTALYADARRWQQEGWLDYLAPQLYWAIDSRRQSFPRLLAWWGQQNTAGRHLWPGLFDSRLLPDVGGYTPQEIVDQTALVRRDGVATGVIHYSAKALAERWRLGPILADGLYAEPALVPASPWLDSQPPPPPTATLPPGGRIVAFSPALASEPVRHWIVREQGATGIWTWRLLPDGQRTAVLDPASTRVAVAAVDRTGNEGPAVLLDVTP